MASALTARMAKDGFRCYDCMRRGRELWCGQFLKYQCSVAEARPCRLFRSKPRSRQPKRPSTSIQQSTVDTSVPFSAWHFEYSTEYSTYIPYRQTAIGWPTVDSGACSGGAVTLAPMRFTMRLGSGEPLLVSRAASRVGRCYHCCAQDAEAERTNEVKRAGQGDTRSGGRAVRRGRRRG
eukprot:1175582-Prorocentrum_minimum.AAC.4